MTEENLKKAKRQIIDLYEKAITTKKECLSQLAENPDYYLQWRIEDLGKSCKIEKMLTDIYQNINDDKAIEKWCHIIIEYATNKFHLGISESSNPIATLCDKWELETYGKLHEIFSKLVS